MLKLLALVSIAAAEMDHTAVPGRTQYDLITAATPGVNTGYSLSWEIYTKEGPSGPVLHQNAVLTTQSLPQNMNVNFGAVF